MMKRLSVLFSFAVLVVATTTQADSLTVTGTLLVEGNPKLGTNDNSSFRALWGSRDATVGPHSMLFGTGSVPGMYSGAFGYGHNIPGHHAFALGVNNTVEGTGAIALGFGLTARPYAAAVVGLYNATNSAWLTTSADTSSDPIFIIGNGTAATRSNALVVTKAGDMRLDGKTNLAAGAGGHFTMNGNFLAKGSTNQLPNQNATVNADILTVGEANERYVQIGGPGNISIGGTLGVTGATTVTTLSTSGNLTAGSALGVTGNITGSGSNNTLASQSLTVDGSIVTRVTGDARYVEDAQLTAYRTIADSYSLQGADTAFLDQSEADARYPRKTGPLVVGTSNTVAGTATHAIGSNLTVNGAYQTLLGRYNTTGSFSSTDWIDTEPLFVIGNGSSSQPSNAVTVLKNGATTIHGNLSSTGNLTGNGTNNKLPNQEVTDDSSILTKARADELYLTQEQADDLYSGLPPEGGFLTKEDADGYYLPVSTSFVAPATLTSAINTAVEGITTTLQADYYTKTDANGEFLNLTEADGFFLTKDEADALYVPVSSGGGSGSINAEHFAVGTATAAPGANSVAMGNNTTAQGANQVVMGRYNVLQGNATDWVETDDLLVVGNGTDDTHRSNAMVVKRNGDVVISGEATISRITPKGDVLMGEFGE